MDTEVTYHTSAAFNQDTKPICTVKTPSSHSDLRLFLVSSMHHPLYNMTDTTHSLFHAVH